MTERDRPFTRLVFSSEYKELGHGFRHNLKRSVLSVRLMLEVIDWHSQSRQLNETARKLIIGSHIDTVAAGGRFDGIAGVIAGLETITLP